MTVAPPRDVRNHFSDVIDRVEHEHERVTVTRNGRPVAIIISPDDLDELEETLAVLSDRQALADIREADAAYANGDVVRNTDAIRALRPRAPSPTNRSSHTLPPVPSGPGSRRASQLQPSSSSPAPRPTTPIEQTDSSEVT